MTNIMEIAGTVPTFTLGDRLRKAREVAGLEQVPLADMIGVHRQTVSAYEAGKTHPRRHALVAWALATGVSAVWLETGCTPGDSNSEPTVSGSKTKDRRNRRDSLSGIHKEIDQNENNARLLESESTGSRRKLSPVAEAMLQTKSKLSDPSYAQPATVAAHQARVAKAVGA